MVFEVPPIILVVPSWLHSFVAGGATSNRLTIEDSSFMLKTNFRKPSPVGLQITKGGDWFITP